MYISAQDAGQPTSLESTNRAHVTVEVVRNQFDPIFFEQYYAVTIPKNLPTGASVITVEANDADTAVRKYSVLLNVVQLIIDYIHCNYLIHKCDYLFLFQVDFKTLSYLVIGDDSAPEYFEINSETGQLHTKISLETDTTELYRVVI